MNAQRSYSLSHRKIKMRKPHLILVAALLVLLIFTVSGGAERLASKLLLYVKIARLYAEEPDRKLGAPIQTVKKGQITNTWHAPRSGDRLHEGQDIFAPRGTPIHSATSGYVYSISKNPLGGQTISVVGAGGRVYYYAHLDSYAREIAEGDYVTTRTVLGYVGTTGNARGTPPHLHFGVYTTAGAIDPLPLLADGKAKKRSDK
jgi:murein DD-endopeptidase MepM/ murein hydrolase activator NlpD